MVEEIEKVRIVKVVDCPRQGAIVNVANCLGSQLSVLSDPCPYFRETGENNFVGCVYSYRVKNLREK